ncbi:MAG: ABC transporter substrate-binding protein [Erysipelotrichaceae bacterium]
MKLLVLVLLCTLLGCQLEPDTAKTITIQDDLGRDVIIASQPEVVIPLIASLADVWQLAGGEVSATSKEAIDQGIVLDTTPIISQGKEIQSEQIMGMQPDLVILSKDYPDHLAFASLLDQAKIPNLVLQLDSFQDYLSILERFSRITKHDENYQTYGLAQKAEIDALILQAAKQTSVDVLLVRSFSSGIKTKGNDHFVSVMLEELGANNIANDTNSALDELSMEAILENDPSKLFVTTMGSDEAAALTYFQTTIQQPTWQSLSAVQNNAIVLLEQRLFHYKPNAEWSKAYEILYNHLYKTATTP